MLRSLVGSEMCIRDSSSAATQAAGGKAAAATARRAAVRCDRPSVEGDPRPACLVHDPRARRVRPRVPVRALLTLPHLTPPRSRLHHLLRPARRHRRNLSVRRHVCAARLRRRVPARCDLRRETRSRITLPRGREPGGSLPRRAPRHRPRSHARRGGAGSRARRPGGQAPHSARRPRRRRVRHSRGRWRLCNCILEASAPPAGDDDSRGTARRRPRGHQDASVVTQAHCRGLGVAHDKVNIKSGHSERHSDTLSALSRHYF